MIQGCDVFAGENHITMQVKHLERFNVSVARQSTDPCGSGERIYASDRKDYKPFKKKTILRGESWNDLCCNPLESETSEETPV